MHRILAAALTALAAIPGCAQPAQAATSCPKVTAHRTAMDDAPENTVAGIIATAALGASSVELDVQWSSSGFPVLMHDADVSRTTNGTGTPASLGLGALTALLAQDYAPWKTNPAFADVHVPYGWEFMAAAVDGGLDVLVDVHATPTALGMDKLAHYIDLFGWRGRTLVMGSEAQVTAMRAWEPGLRYALVEYNPAATIRRGESLVGLGVEAYAVPARDISPAAVTYWHSYGLQVLTWTSDTPAIDVPATWQRVAGAGVDALITNRPADALDLLCGTGG